ncbi:MAG: ABC transporter permease [Dokdonella sp.]
MIPLFDDLRRALRALLARPTFFVTAVATLALGVCALAAIFTVYDAVLLQPLPYANADRIVDIGREQTPIKHGPVSRQVFQEWRERSTGVFDAFGGYNTSTMNLTGAGDAERLTACAVTPDFWNVFSSPIAAGRVWGKDEEAHDERVVVLSNALWRDRFGAKSDIIGRDIILNETSYRVVGVSAADFNFPTDAQVWFPTYLPSNSYPRGSNYLSMVARLRDGTDLVEARQTLDGIAAWEAKTWPDNHHGLRSQVQSLQASLSGRFHQPLAMLLIAALLVLLIACANLANLMLARGQARAHEFALRRALGADASSVARAVLAEALVIAAIGGIVGLLTSQPAVRTLMALAPSLLPRTSIPVVDASVVSVVVIAALLAMLVAGFAPAWRATRADPADALRGSGRDTGGRNGRLRTWLVSAQIAVALTLLCGSALLIQSLRHLSEVDSGVDSAGVLTARIALPVPALLPGEESTAWISRVKAANSPRIDAILADVAALPGVAEVGMTDTLPVAGIDGIGNGAISLPGHDIPMDQNLADFRFASPDYFASLGIPLHGGRLLNAQDGHDAGLGTHVLVNQSFVDHFLGGNASSALGQQIGIIDDTMKTIVGVVGNVRQSDLEHDPRPEVYFPARAFPASEMSLILKINGDALAFTDTLRRALKKLAPDMPVFSIRTMDEATRQTTLLRRFNLTLMSIFAGVALLLAAIGMYGVIAYAVGQRRREIGVRQAIGADAHDIHRLMFGAGLRMIVPGIVIGIIGSLALGRVIAAQLYGVNAANPFVLASVAALLFAVALIACAIPTLRAARIPPMEALRNE